jgi:AmmeMemoRadiSam system protein B
MHLAQRRGWSRAARRRSSGDTAGDRRRVVGYASVVYHAPPA